MSRPKIHVIMPQSDIGEDQNLLQGAGIEFAALQGKLRSWGIDMVVHKSHDDYVKTYNPICGHESSIYGEGERKPSAARAAEDLHVVDDIGRL